MENGKHHEYFFYFINKNIKNDAQFINFLYLCMHSPNHHKSFHRKKFLDKKDRDLATKSL
ncbi:hypothetical protein AXF22_11530 [Prevotella scopos JCM 17725]|nr:hypothetical protein AXF22_11530 [Prevotella scopos JCM 17725]